MKHAGRMALLAGILAVPLALVGCPLPQPLAEVGRVDGGTVSVPPRILVSTALPPDSRVLVSRSCPASPRFDLQAQVDDLDTTEQVEARWFVDYDPSSNVGIARPPDAVVGSGDPSITVRPLPIFTYVMPAPDAANTVHVVEVVVSNGFAPSGPGVPYPNRMPADGYEVQVFRWVFQYADSGGRCQYP